MYYIIFYYIIEVFVNIPRNLLSFSLERLKVKNTLNGTSGNIHLPLGYGFFTKTVDEQIFLLKIVLKSAEYHELVPYQSFFPLDESKLFVGNNRRLRIGYYVDDGFMKPVPA